MSYTITIGERKTFVDEEGNSFPDVDDVTCEEAPAFGDPSDHHNYRWPAYTIWHNFTRETGLEDLFYNEKTGLMREHPGCFPLTAAHAWAIRRAVVEYEGKHREKNLSPGFRDFDWKTGLSIGTHTDEDATLARLIWLDWWVRWALDHCTFPVISNS